MNETKEKILKILDTSESIKNAFIKYKNILSKRSDNSEPKNIQKRKEKIISKLNKEETVKTSEGRSEKINQEEVLKEEEDLVNLDETERIIINKLNIFEFINNILNEFDQLTIFLKI